MAWRGVLKSMGQVTDDKCSEILALSYKDLPTLLKPCFLYLGLFPKDYEMKACRVIRMWMAENFIQGIGKLEPEDVGDNYLNTLDARNLIQVISRKYDGRIKRFRIHHLLRDLCVNVGKEINFLHIITNDSVESRSGSIKTRRLGIQNVDVDSLVNSNIEAHKVRALFIFGTEEKSIAVEQVEKILARFKLLRVLNFGVPTSSELVNINNFRLLENLPLLKNLSLLKYLQFSAGGFAVIPRIISHEMLQTVDYGMSLFPNYIPISMWKKKQLRHVSLQVWGDTRTLNTHELCLPNLQTLRAFVYHLDLGWLNKFNNLRKLRLGCVNGETIDVLCGESEPMSKKLETLYLESFRGAVTSVIDLSKYSQLMKLTIVMEIRKLPNPRNFPPNIVKLRLEKTGLIKDPMQVLKKLLNLKILILDSQSYLGATLDYSGLGSFPRLEVLLLRSLMELLELVDGDEGRLPPNLRQVIIKGCRKSPRVPESLEPFVTRSLRAWDTTG